MMGEQQQGGKGAAWRALAATVPADHILRRIDCHLDLAELRDALAPHYSRQGRPSIAPELLIRMALIGRLYAITSERQLCEEVRFNLAYRWFCRLPLDIRVPHHSKRFMIVSNMLLGIELRRSSRPAARRRRLPAPCR